MTDEQKCIADLVSLIMGITDNVSEGDLSFARPTRTAGGGINLGTPPVCRISLELFDKYEDVIRAAFRAKEIEDLEKKGITSPL